MIYNFKSRYQRGRKPWQFGVGINYAYSSKMTEWGLIVNSNVFNEIFAIQRNLMFYPVVYGQLGHQTVQSIETKESDLNGRVGLGIIGNQMVYNRTSIRTSIKLGYVFSKVIIPKQSGWSFEFKLGVGWNGRGRNKSKKIDSD